MQLGMIGLGRMGANMARRLMRNGHECVVYDRDVDAVAGLAQEGAIGTKSLDEFVGKLLAQRIIPELKNEAAPDLKHDSSTNTLIWRYRRLRGRNS